MLVRLMPTTSRKIQIWAAVLLSLVVAHSAPALAERRIALVVGNGGYGTAEQRHPIPELENPKNDAEDVAQALRDVGFEVIERIDVDQKELKTAIRDFARILKDLEREDIGLFFYAGHGVQVEGRNYMIPIGAEIEREDDVDLEGVDLRNVLKRMKAPRNRVNIVILDACRENPFKESFDFPSQGLAESPAPPGTFIAYAAGPGQVAFDGDEKDRNSIFSGELVKAIREPGLKIEELFKQVRGKVRQETGGRQVPWTLSSLTEDFYFIEPEAPTDPFFEIAFWDDVKNSDDPGDLEAYLEQFPNGNFVPLAKNRLEKLRKKDDGELAALPSPDGTSPEGTSPEGTSPEGIDPPPRAAPEREYQLALALADRWYSGIYSSIIERKARQATQSEAIRQLLEDDRRRFELESSEAARQLAEHEAAAAAQRAEETEASAREEWLKTQRVAANEVAQGWFEQTQTNVSERLAAEAAAQAEAGRLAAEAAAQAEAERQVAALIQQPDTPGSAAQIRLDAAAILGSWCSDNVQIELSRDSWEFRLPSGDQVSFNVRGYDVQSDAIWVHWIDQKKKKIVTEFGRFSEDSNQMVQIRGRLESSDVWHDYDRVFSRC